MTANAAIAINEYNTTGGRGMADSIECPEAPNPVWAAAATAGAPDKMEAAGGLFMKFLSGIIKTMQRLGLDKLLEDIVAKVVAAAANRAMNQIEDKWLGK